MPDQRKPPLNKGSRPEGATLPADSGGFSIESTTMRLKSMKLRRAESERQEAERLAASKDKGDTVRIPRKDERPAGRVRHDERGMAVWDWAVATGEFATLSATHALKKLSIEELNERIGRARIQRVLAQIDDRAVRLLPPALIVS